MCKFEKRLNDAKERKGKEFTSLNAYLVINNLLCNYKKQVQITL
jgi:hypothetical protein